MTRRFPASCPKFPHMLHGGDYNPDQWIATQEVWDEDMRLMRLAHCNAMTTGIFAWSALEPEEGRFEFGWLDAIMDKIDAAGGKTVLATPSGARPAWLAQKYPEVLRTTRDRRKKLFGGRHDHCLTSPLYREKVSAINRRLAERYAGHPALILWHISNEYGGECHCDLCQEAFRAWLRTQYADLDALNRTWWNAFWSHTISDWSQIASPSPLGEELVHGLTIDWKRFVTHQTISFFRNEIAPLRELTPEIPVTTNLMAFWPVEVDVRRLARECDVVSWDSYPSWDTPTGNASTACFSAMLHSMHRSHKRKPFLLMESTPSMTNWQPVAKLKRPGMHKLSSLQAVAYGADGVQYFQWRKSRGSCEKFHGAVVDHCGHENTRVFADVAEVGRTLEKLDDVVGTMPDVWVALVYDWENSWGVADSACLGHRHKDLHAELQSHWRPYWRRGVAADIVGMDDDFSPYQVVIAPMLYMVKPGVAERLERFVEAGGTFVATYWTGIADEHDLCFLTGFPGPLRKLLGVWAEEIDALYETDRNAIVMQPRNEAGLAGTYEVRDLCDLIHAETASVQGVYASDFYAERPALTVNAFGKGKAWYIAARAEERFLDDFHGGLVARLGLPRALEADVPEGVCAAMRTDGQRRFVFVMNFSGAPANVTLDAGKYRCLETGREWQGTLALEVNGVAILERL